jgi:hypothetical protein
VSTGGDEAEVHLAKYTWLVVMNQECDLQQDRLARAGHPVRQGGNPVRKDKCLRTILLCPAFPEDHVLAGIYIEGATSYNSAEKRTLLDDRHERYHRLPPEPPLLEEGLLLDFKLIVATSPEYLEKWMMNHPGSQVAALNPPYRDRLIQRFVNYFGRIPEPDEP